MSPSPCTGFPSSHRVRAALLTGKEQTLCRKTPPARTCESVPPTPDCSPPCHTADARHDQVLLPQLVSEHDSWLGEHGKIGDFHSKFTTWGFQKDRFIYTMRFLLLSTKKKKKKQQKIENLFLLPKPSWQAGDTGVWIRSAVTRFSHLRPDLGSFLHGGSFGVIVWLYFWRWPCFRFE